jgi:hypothetical protein
MKAGELQDAPNSSLLVGHCRTEEDGQLPSSLNSAFRLGAIVTSAFSSTVLLTIENSVRHAYDLAGSVSEALLGTQPLATNKAPFETSFPGRVNA